MVIITILILEEAVLEDKKVKVLECSWDKAVNQYLYFEKTEFWTPKILTSLLDFFSNISICLSEQLSTCSWLKPFKVTQCLQVYTTVTLKRLDVAHIYYIFTDIYSDILSFIFPVLTVDNKVFCIASNDFCLTSNAVFS